MGVANTTKLFIVSTVNKWKLILTVFMSNVRLVLDIMHVIRGFQYMHQFCVMRKCIMVKLGGNEKHKVCKKHVNFTKSGQKFAKVGGNNFPEIGGTVMRNFGR